MIGIIITAIFPACWGFVGGGAIEPIIWAVLLALNNVLFLGWRAPNGRLPTSFLWGFIFSASVTALGYVVGYGVARLTG